MGVGAGELVCSGAELKDVRVLGPAAAPISRLKRIYRYHFVLKAERRDVLGAALRKMLASDGGIGDSAEESGGGCGCGAPDVNRETGKHGNCGNADLFSFEFRVFQF